MQLQKNSFEKLINELTSIEVSLDWDHNQGRAEVQGYIMKTPEFYLEIDLTCYQYGKNDDDGDYLTPPSFTLSGVQTEINSLDVFQNDTEEKIQITENQHILICEQIISLITTS